MDPTTTNPSAVVSAINSILIGLADVVLGAWHGIVDGLGWLIGAIDALLNPILSPILAFLNPICNWLGDAVYAVLGLMPPWVGLTLLSGLSGVLALFVFRHMSNQKRIGRVKDDMKANLLALKLFKDELGVTFRCQLKLLWAVARLQRYMIVPFLVMLPPMLLLLAQMGLRHQWRPLRPDEVTTMRVALNDAESIRQDDPVVLEPSPGVAEAVGVPGADDMVWRIRAGEPGRYMLQFREGQKTFEKELVVGAPFERVSAVRTSHHWGAQLLNPVEPCLPSDSNVAFVTIDYPGVDSWIDGANWWLLFFFVVSMGVALIFKPLFKVRF